MELDVILLIPLLPSYPYPYPCIISNLLLMFPGSCKEYFQFITILISWVSHWSSKSSRITEQRDQDFFFFCKLWNGYTFPKFPPSKSCYNITQVSTCTNILKRFSAKHTIPTFLGNLLYKVQARPANNTSVLRVQWRYLWESVFETGNSTEKFNTVKSLKNTRYCTIIMQQQSERYKLKIKAFRLRSKSLGKRKIYAA